MTSDGGRDRFAGRTVLITGSTGMAASAAKAVAAEGGAVFAVSRTATHLAALAASAGGGGTPRGVSADVLRGRLLDAGALLEPVAAGAAA